MNYREARAYVDDAQQYAGDMGLTNTQYMLDALGHPEDEPDLIHVAGTNGKGSVSSYIASVLEEAGYRVGRYVSPTILSYRERFQIDGEWISRTRYTSYVEQLQPLIERMQAEGYGHPTPFEIETVIAFLYFQDEACDVAIIECGMGGIWDATNAVRHTTMSVITSISMDHTAVLGNSLTGIAENKAGIIKPGSIVVMGKQEPEVEETLWAICTEKGNRFIAAKPQEAVIRDITLDHQTFRYHGTELTVCLAGSHQVENAVLALECLQALRQIGYRLTEEDIEKGFAKARWDGRFTIFGGYGGKPFIVIDGAHNPSAAEKLKISVQTYFPDRRLIFIMGMFRDKDYQTVASVMAPMAERIFTVTPPVPERALPAEELAETVRNYQEHVTTCGTIEEAFRESLAAAGPDDVILSFGSLSFAGEMLGLAREYTGEV